MGAWYSREGDPLRQRWGASAVVAMFASGSFGLCWIFLLRPRRLKNISATVCSELADPTLAETPSLLPRQEANLEKSASGDPATSTGQLSGSNGPASSTAELRPKYTLSEMMAARHASNLDGELQSICLGIRAQPCNVKRDVLASGGNDHAHAPDACSTPPPTVYCDLDGVLCDFEGAVAALFQRPYERIKKSDMWWRLSETRDFYAKLPWLDEGLKLWEGIRALSPAILSGVPQDWGGVASKQKRRWVRRELGDHVPILTCLKEDKWQMCRSGDILIDDNSKLREEWEKAGGIFVHYTGDAASSLSLLLQMKVLPPTHHVPSVRWVQVRWESDWWWCKIISEDKRCTEVEFMEPPHAGVAYTTELIAHHGRGASAGCIL